MKSQTDPAAYYESQVGQTEGTDTRLSETQRSAARLVICANADNAEEAREWMAMCGILPGQEDGADDFRVAPAYPMNNSMSAPAYQ